MARLPGQPVPPGPIDLEKPMPTTTRTWILLVAATLLVACGEEEKPPPQQQGESCPNEVGVLCTWAGTGEEGFNGDDQPIDKSQLALPMDVAFDPGNTAYVVDYGNHRIRKVQPHEGTFKTVVGTGVAGNGDPDEYETTPSGAWGDLVELTHPSDVFVDASGALVISSWGNHRVRRWDPETNVLRVLAGTEMGYEGDGGRARDAKLNGPSRAIQVDSGEIYVLDQRNQRVRRISNEPVPKITSPIGSGSRGISAGTRPAPEAKFSFYNGMDGTPEGGLAVDRLGNVYLADTGANRIYRVSLVKREITHFAGKGTPGYSGDGGPALEAEFNGPRDLVVFANKLYVADTENHAVRVIELGSGTVSTLAGNGSPGFSGDGGPAKDAQLDRPHGVAVDPKGVLYISDTFNHRIRRVRLQ